MFNNYIFIILIIFFIFLIGKKTKEINDKNKLGFNEKILLTISILSTFIIYYTAPVGRLGTSFIVVLIYFIFYFLFKNKINIFAQNKTKKIITLILILTGTIFITKNISKIFVNYNVKFHNSPWPRIYENQKDISFLSSNSNKPVNHEYELKNNVLKVYYVNKLSYWRPAKREEKCLYNKSPCAQSGLNFENFDVKKISFDYFMIKLRK